LGIIYKLLEGSQGDRKKVIRKKDKKKVRKYYKLSEGRGGEGRGGRVENCHSKK
jgi:hypothetical protein